MVWLFPKIHAYMLIIKGTRTNTQTRIQIYIIQLEITHEFSNIWLSISLSTQFIVLSYYLIWELFCHVYGLSISSIFFWVEIFSIRKSLLAVSRFRFNGSCGFRNKWNPQEYINSIIVFHLNFMHKWLRASTYALGCLIYYQAHEYIWCSNEF